ncbi:MULTISPECIES: hypothetical protein [Streptomyces]|uniref:AG2 protein n=1 Tax=Streptomyces griseus subsp. griseus (strain JCM 4626 / CBS 651.72 / NBRC 13350 / KCC S-0626 / ISP 5235) TaxID=455632 RepID=B1VVR4_STRGG|nr:hypothetical protein [Streptomyces griseus]BAG21425.1 hypothetical protein SGR_4596 [Streptomyces griseus subsp. griseus NBRC 13350]SEE66593.1 hypothetical protein SAMN04490359_4896 [Streptomyces griseus]SQA22963.1 Uncharacterised protein [Streptomyces griseus]
MLNYEDIVEAPLGKLKAAADDWSEMAANLDRLATQASDGMKAKANKASWEGLNAGVTREFIGKTAKEFTDAAAEAKGVKTLLEEGYTAFKKAKDDLVNIRDHEGPAAGIRVDGRGKVTARSPISEDNTARHDPDFGRYLQQERENIASWQKRIDLIVDNCNDTDVTFKNSLEANVTDRKDFSAPKYTKFDQEEADRAAALAAKGRDLTHTELQSLNELLRDNGKSPEFAKAFYEKLGPEKSLAFFGQLSTDTHDYAKVDKTRLADVQELQRNLGLNLATASHDQAFSAEWGPELRKLGTQQIPLSKYDNSGGPYGYQLLGGIMRYGNYDAKFLNPIAEHVAQLHQQDPYRFAGNKQVNGFLENPYNPSGKNGAGYDPTTAMLEALGNSPDAAKKFFTDEPTAYNEDGTVNHGATADLGKKDDAAIDNYLDFFGNEKWESFPDSNSTDPDKLKPTLQHMPDALGHALEAATLGYPAGDPDASVKRDADNAAVMQQVMEKYGADAGLLKHQEGLADSMGVMGAGYIDDINWALDKGDSNSVFAPDKNIAGHIPFGADGEEGRSTVRQFLSALGQHPDAYATLSTAEQAYTRSVLETQVSPDGTIDADAARTTVRVGAEMQGMLDQSRADQVQAENMKTHEDYEKAVAERAGWVEFGAGVGIAAGVAFLPATAAVGAAAVLIPLATDTAGGLAEQVVGQVVGDVSDNSVDKSKEKAEQLTDEEWDRIYRSGESMAEAPMENFLALHATAEDTKLREDLKQAMLLGYGVGNDRENQQGVNPETG